MGRSLAALIDALRAERAPAGDGDGMLVLAAEAPIADVRALLDAGLGGERLLWDATALEGPGAWAIAGRGEALRVSSAGADRVAELEVRAGRALGALAVDDGGLALPPPRLFGGVAFQPRREASPRDPGDAPWAGFGDASFTLPRWLYARRGGAAFVRLAVRAGELGALADEAADVLEALERAARAPAGASRAAPGATWGAELEPMSARSWEALVADALARIRARELDKVVAARQTRLSSRGPIDLGDVLARLAGSQPGCAEFALQRGDAVFLGASPERLVVKHGLAIETEALAGSAPRREGDGGEGAAALLGSDKDRREQELVVRGIRAALAPLCERLDVGAVPRVRTLRSVHHLSTPIRGTLARPLHVLRVLEALHPTPAVSGLPRERAIAWIAAHEPAPRGWYASPVGWIDAAGDGAFAVAIRSALVAGDRAWLYAGAGIVLGSDPRLEYAETAVKQAAMLAALGVA